MADETGPTTPEPAGRQPDEQPDRQAQPVDAELPPRLPFPVVGVGASAGGIEAFSELLAATRSDPGMAFVFILHLPPDADSHLAEVLGRRTAMPVRQVADGMPVEPDHVYVTRPGHVLTIRDGHLRLGPELGGPRAANRPVDDFFKSLAEEQRERAIGVILSGTGSNGTAGAQAVKAVGGLMIAQDPDSARYPSMPRHLVDAGYADHVLRPADVPEVLLAYAGSPYAAGGREADAREVLDREGQHLREILAVLRTRSRQDFTGYKKPTVLRRVQRRMGLTRTETLADYARLMRRTPAEVIALADDLLIHVTGFFRDPEAWEALRQRVVVPLVAGRRPGEAVRAWVTACSSGEEAYSLAMLLVEEGERAGKPLDVKVFATDLADRALAHARAGVYPGGIESEIAPERLTRFFTREAEVYRVRADLRDRVVFASQNLLQDPPFSRLDVATCRNLLIYLEADVQRRVLHLLHFGLRESGALFLGTSETVAGVDGLFEPVDKKARIFRRVGPTRHGSVDFPLPHALPAGAAGLPAPARPRRADGPPASVAEVTRQALLDAHTPPAVTVDRDHHIVYYHGDPGPYLRLSGEPTRDLLLAARDGVRGAVRAALLRAAADNARVTVTDGWLDREPGRRSRVAVTASPAPDPAADADTPPAYFVVSFDDRGEEPPAPAAAGGASSDELRRLRGELQGSIEELQTSNEELRAANEEVTSVNEELQSANEELETSKEEMQSLNEELQTVNSQLRAKMEEHQATSSDLTALLASTDLAVLFLDTDFRIRRFTPPARDLIDLIPGDVGRPVGALARRFDDPHLDADARAVLDRLVPAAREVAGAAGRHYLRRVTPYRTTDNRIDGVVVTFVDITDRKRAEEALAEEKEYAEKIVETLHEPLLVLHPDLRVKGANPAFFTHFRVDPAGTVGRKVYHLGNGQWDIPALRRLLEDVLPDSNVFNDYEVTHDFEGLGRRVMLVNARRLDHVQLILLGVRDVTERVRAEDRLRQMLNIGVVGVIVFDAAGALVEANDAFLRMTGYARADVAARALSWRTMTPPEHTAESERQMAQLPATGRIGPYEKEYVRADGSRAWMLFAGAALGDGTVVEYVIDVADRKRAEEALAASEEQFRRAIEDAPIPVVMQAEDGQVLQLSRTWTELTGYSLADVPTADAWLTTAYGPGADAVRDHMHDLFGGQRKSLDVEFAIRTRDGDDRQWSFSASAPGALRDGRRYMVGMAVDVTRRRRAEDALREGEERLRLALAAARMGTWALDLATATQTRDANLNRLLGLDGAETTQPFDEFLGHVEPADRAAVRAAFEAAAAGRRLSVEFRVVWPDGTVRWLRDQGEVFPPAAEVGPRMAGACVDVTERREAEEALRASEERLRLVVESATDYAILTLAPDRTVTTWSPGAEATFGYAAGEMVGRSGDDLFTPEDRAAGAPEGEAATALRDGRAADERWHVRKDGTRFWASGVLNPLGPGGALGFVKVLRDLTERKRVADALQEARERLEERVTERTAQLTAALETLETEMARRRELAGRLATAQEDERKRVARDLHDTVGQLLAGLALAFKAVETAGHLPPPAAARLAEAQRVADELGKEVHALAMRLRPTSLDDLGLGAALDQLVREWSARAGVPADFQAVGLDRGRLPPEVETTVYRVVQEALTNVAKHARATRASVGVTVQGGRVTVAVEDDGAGFDPAAPTARLGLLGMRERVALLGGEVEIESAPGAGTTVLVGIPAAPAGGGDGP